MTRAKGPRTLFVEENHDFPLVELVMITRTGSVHDPRGKEGAYALALRSLRRGAGARTSTQIDDEIDRLGADYSSAVDASTGALHATVLRRNLERFLDLFADLVMRPNFPQSEVEQVLRETRAAIIDSRDDDRTLAARHFRRVLFAGHPYGRPSGGLLKSLDALTPGDAAAAYSAHLRKENLVWGAAGDITANELTKLLDERFGAISDEAPLPIAIEDPSPRKGRRLVIVDKPARTQTQIYIGGIGTHPRDRDHTALHLGNTIFGGTFTARLMKEVRSKRGWSYGASSRLGRDRAREAWWMWTFPAATDAAECIALQLKMLDQLIDKGVTERELAFTKSYLVKSYAFDVDTASKRLGQQLDEEVVPLPKGYYARFIERVQAVTRDEVNAALRKRFSRDNLLVTIVATAGDLRAKLEDAIPDLEETRVLPFDTDELPT